MNYKEFYKLINSGSLNGAYLLHGEEEYVKSSAVKRVQDKIPAEFRTFNLAVLYEPDLKKLVEACETLPVFTDRTYVVVKELGNGADTKKLMDYIGSMSPTTVLLIVKKGELDRKNALLAAFKKLNREVLFARIDVLDAVKWCLKTAGANNVRIDEQTARAFVDTVSTDMTAVSSELEKLIDRVGPGGVITQETILETSIGSIENKTFGMLDLFLKGRTADGMRSLRLLLNEVSSAPIRMAGFLQSRVRQMLKARLLMDQGMNPQAAAAKLDGNLNANKYICRDAGRYTTEGLRDLLSRLSLVSYNNITGRMNTENSLENIMLTFDWRGNVSGSNISARVSQTRSKAENRYDGE